MSSLKSLLLYIIAGGYFLGFSNVIYAQNILGGESVGSVDSYQRWYFDQARVSQPYTAGQCIGANNNVRYYLSSDHDGDGLFDYKLNYRLRDNFWTSGASNSVKVALLTARIAGSSIGTNVSYYTPQSNILSVFANNQNYNLDTTKTWYRQSNIAPKDVIVRAVESEPVLFEIPSTQNPLDARFQVTYTVRFKDYDSIKPSGNSTYLAYQIPNASFAGPVTNANAWYLNTLTPSFDAFYGPNWPANYTNGVSFSTRSIQWQEPEKTHALECFNGYLSRCGDGYIDVSGQQPTNSSTVQPYTISDLNVSEQCDPGSNLSSWSDDVMPNGAVPTATYNCSSICNIINTPIDPVITYTKTVRNVTTNSNGGQFVEADTAATAVIVNTGDFVQYQITVSKVGGPVNNVIVVDNLPINNGFIMTGYSINGGPIISATFLPSLGIDAQLNAGNVTITLYGYVGNPTANVFLNGVVVFDSGVPVNTLAPGSNNAWTRLPDFVSTPMLRIEKYWIDPNNVNLTGDVYTVAPNTPIKFILRVRNIGNVSAIGIITDVCPTNLNCQTYRILPSLFNQTYLNTISVGSVPVGGYVDVEVTAVAFTDAISTSLINTAQLYINSVNPANFMNEDNATLNTVRTVDFDVIKSVLSGSVNSGSLITYRIEFRNTGNTPITSYVISDNLPSTIQYVPNTARLNGTIFVNPIVLGNVLTRGCNVPGNISLNGQSVCPLQSGMSGFITFDALVL